LAQPVQLVVPVPAGTPVGTRVIFYRADHLPDAQGNPVQTWMETEVGTVAADGFAHTTSTNAITLSATFMFGNVPNSGVVKGKVSVPVGGVNDGGNAFAMSANLGNGAAVGATMSVTSGVVIDLPIGLSLVHLLAIPKQGLPVLTPITIDVRPGGTNINPTVNV